MNLRMFAMLLCLVLLLQGLTGCASKPTDPQGKPPVTDGQPSQAPEDPDASADPNAVYYTVTFDGNDAYTRTASQSVKSGEPAAEPNEPRRMGYVFEGWTHDGEPWEFTSPVTADLTLTASWGEIVYSEGLRYSLLADGTYSVRMGSATNDTWIHIPPTHKGIAVTKIPNFGFANAKNVKRVIVPNSVTHIGTSAFAGCDALEYLSLPFVGVQGNQSLGVLFDNDGTTPKTLKTVEVTGNAPLGTKKLFQNQTGLTSVAIVSGTELGAESFSVCIQLKHVLLPPTLERIGNEAFYNCLTLSIVTLPATVTEIGRGAFSVCPSLRVIEFEGTVAQWEAITKDPRWRENSGMCTVYCTDGTVLLEA